MAAVAPVVLADIVCGLKLSAGGEDTDASSMQRPAADS
jgi:hypothetical protein